MPNHVTNRLNLIGEQSRIDELLDKIKTDELGRGTIDFNKIIPMPEALDVESGSVESDAIKAYTSMGLQAKRERSPLQSHPLQAVFRASSFRVILFRLSLAPIRKRAKPLFRTSFSTLRLLQ